MEMILPVTPEITRVAAVSRPETTARDEASTVSGCVADVAWEFSEDSEEPEDESTILNTTLGLEAPLNLPLVDSY